MKQVVSVLKYVAMLGVGVVLFWLAARNMNFAEVLEKASEIKVGYILLAGVAAILSHWSRAVRWNLLINPLGYNVRWSHSFLAVLMGYFANLFLPRMGEVTRCVVVNRTDKVPVDTLIGTVVAERIVDMLTLILIVFINLAIEFDLLKKLLIDNGINAIASKAGESGSIFTFTNIIIGIVALALAAGAAVFFFMKFRRSALFVRVMGVVKNVMQGVRSVGKIKKPGYFILHTIFMWGMYYMMVYICFLALGPTEHLGMIAALSVLVMGSFGFVAPVQGGIGAYEVMVILTLTAYGLSGTDAGTFALVAHSFQIIVFLLAGVISYFVLSFKYRRIKAEADAELPLPDTAKTVS